MSSITTTTHPGASIAPLTWVQRHPLIAYFAIAFAGTWAMLIPMAMSLGFNLFAIPDAVFFLLYFFSPYAGPMLGALVVTRMTEGGPGVRRLLKRIVQWRVGIPWYLAAIFTMLLIWLAAYSLLYSGTPLRALISNPMLLVSPFLINILIGILIPSLGEEVGWRGYALPKLQGQYGPVVGSLILGALHGLWHLPVLFTPMLGEFTAAGMVAFILTAVPATFFYTWIANNARGSIWIAILLHASSNAASVLLNEIVPQEVMLAAPIQALVADGWINTIIFALAALALVVLTRGRLGYKADAKVESGLEQRTAA